MYSTVNTVRTRVLKLQLKFRAQYILNVKDSVDEMHNESEKHKYRHKQR
jgi:hypothetical protein